MDTSSDARPTAGPATTKRGWLRSIITIVIFDIAGPLAAYSGLRSAGLTAAAALMLSGVFPALSVGFGVIRHRRLDVIGALVLAGIVVGVVLGLVFHSPRLVQVEGSVPTVFFGVVCLASLRSRPLMFSLAMEFIGPDTARGREMTGLWQYDGYRHIWRVITAAWGAAFLIEAALRVIVVFNASTGTALAVSKVTPYLFVGVMSAWTVAYGTYRKRKGEEPPPGAAEVTESSELCWECKGVHTIGGNSHGPEQDAVVCRRRACRQDAAVAGRTVRGRRQRADQQAEGRRPAAAAQLVDREGGQPAHLTRTGEERARPRHGGGRRRQGGHLARSGGQRPGKGAAGSHRQGDSGRNCP